MQSDELPDFTRQVEVLCAGFNVPPTDLRVEALWRGLKAMNLVMFTRVVEEALKGGTDKVPIERMPNAPQLWLLSKSMRAQAPAPKAAPLPEGDRFAVITSKMLWLFVYRKGPFVPSVLQQLLAAKAKLIDDFRLIAAEEEVTDLEFGEAVYKRFAAILGVTDIKFDDDKRKLSHA